MVAALCEEVKEPERAVPKAMVLSVVAAAITGVVYLVCLSLHGRAESGRRESLRRTDAIAPNQLCPPQH
jgi:amino acid transporter